MSRLALAALLFLIAGCDAEEPVVPPDGFLVVRAVDARGDAVEGAEVDLLVGTRTAWEADAAVASRQDRVTVSKPYPHPVRGRAEIPVRVRSDTAATAWTRIYVGFANFEERLPVFEGTLPVGDTTLVADFSDLDPGVYMLWAQYGDPDLPSGNGSTLYVTAEAPGEAPVVVPLGAADADGFVSVVRPQTLPFVDFGEDGISVYDASGEYRALVYVEAAQTLRLRAPDGRSAIHRIELT